MRDDLRVLAPALGALARSRVPVALALELENVPLAVAHVGVPVEIRTVGRVLRLILLFPHAIQWRLSARERHCIHK